MSPELEKKLTEKHGTLLRCSLDIDDGWYDLVDLACTLLAKSNEVCGADSYIDTCKEKFGGLRLYDGYETEPNPVIQSFLAAIESISCDTCEICGKRGSRCQPKGFWIRTLCPKCLENEKLS